MASFSQKLQTLLASKQPITLGSINNNFAQKSFAILLLLLLAIPALPLPTGGITHIFEIIAMLIALELIAGRKTIWLPKRWLNKPLPPSMQKSALPRFIKIIKWVEKYSKPRLTGLQANSFYIRLLGLFVLVFTVFAFLAPPFSGLDTLPALGVVILSLSLIFDDLILYFIGLIVGACGILLIFLLGSLIFKLF